MTSLKSAGGPYSPLKTLLHWADLRENLVKTGKFRLHGSLERTNTSTQQDSTTTAPSKKLRGGSTKGWLIVIGSGLMVSEAELLLHEEQKKPIRLIRSLRLSSRSLR